ncbi:MAG: HAD family phosphatase [Deltaproteobacteria bacterium]|nr:HAD family phosphatase [Deltaproteobacteria bacterium]
MDSPPIRALIFDLGRVLVGLDLQRGLFGELARASTADQDTLLATVLDDELFRAFSCGRISPEDFHRAVMERTGLGIDYPAFKQLWCDIFLPMPGMAELVAELCGRMPVGLLSDTDPLHWAHELRANPWLGLIRKPTLSFEIGCMKPEPACYQIAARNVGRPPEECLFVDDLERNVEGAIRVGMQALRFEGVDALRADLRRRGLL